MGDKGDALFDEKIHLLPKSVQVDPAILGEWRDRRANNSF
jgi:hypothetical protein